MKKLILTTLIICINTMGFTQPWVKDLRTDKQKKDLSLYDYIEAFDKYNASKKINKRGYYKSNGTLKKAAGWKQFNRWVWEMKSHINPQTGKFPKKSRLQVYRDFKRSLKSSSQTAAQWKLLGPTTSNGGYAGIGRINCIAFHPTDINSYWVGAGTGGVWSTKDDGKNWNYLSKNTGIQGVTEIIIPSDYETSKTIYVATGDRDHFKNRSIGVIKSTDEGQTWNSTGFSCNINNPVIIYRMILDPNDNNTLILTTNTGIFKTTDAGESWSENIFDYNISFTDIDFKPNNFSVLYATSYNGEIFRSNNTGDTWTSVYASQHLKSIQLSTTISNANIVYGICLNNVYALGNIIKSEDAGETFNIVFSGTTKNLLGWKHDGSDSEGQGWYDLTIEVSPFDENLVLVGGINTWRSTTGGLNWEIINHWNGVGAPTVHADKHSLEFRSNGDLFECNDGGIYKSINNGTTFIDKSNGLSISQVYKIGISNSNENIIIAGLQDNGTKLLNNSTWTDILNSDGAECFIDYTDDNIQYASYTKGSLFKTLDKWNTSESITVTGVGAGTGTSSWIAPFCMDPVNPNTLYVGYKNLYKSTDKGENWIQISSLNTDYLLSIAISPSNTSCIFTANDINIWKTTDIGSSWSSITNNLPITTSKITGITVKHDDENTIWVTLDAFNNNCVFESINGGLSWSNISSGLPQAPCYKLIQNIKSNYKTQLYVATELGVFFKEGSNDWIEYNTDLPKVRSSDIEIKDGETVSSGKIILGSYGRGVWESPVSVPRTALPIIETISVSDILTNTVTASGKILSQGSESIIESGFVWSTGDTPTTNDTKILGQNNNNGIFNLVVIGLLENKTYYIRAFAKNNNGTFYGKTITFTTNCISTELPFQENFYSLSLPECWRIKTSNNTDINWQIINRNDNQNQFELKVTSNSSGSMVSRLIMPIINSLNKIELKLSFKHSFRGRGAGGLNIKIQSSSNGVTWDNETWGLNSSNISTQDSIISTIITRNLNSTNTYIAFVIEGSIEDLNYWKIDNIMLIDNLGKPVISHTNNTTCDKGDIVVNSNLLGNQTYYLYESDGLTEVKNSGIVGSSSYKFSQLSSGKYKVKVIKSNNSSDLSTIIDLENSILPEIISDIVGNKTPKIGSIQVYSVVKNDNATYNWSLPENWIGNSSTNWIQTTITENGGQINVIPINECGEGGTKSLNVVLLKNSVIPQATLTAIPGCKKGIIRIKSSLPGPQVFDLLNSDGISIIESSGVVDTNYFDFTSLDPGSYKGKISAEERSYPISEKIALTTLKKPKDIEIIQGNLSPCIGSSQEYKVPIGEITTSFVWTIPEDWTGESNSNNITVNIGNSKGKITVKGENKCLSGNIKTLLIDTKKNTTPPLYVTSKDTVICKGESIDLNYLGGEGLKFVWFKDSCGNNSIGTGNNLKIYPSQTSTFFGRWENDCNKSECKSVKITVNNIIKATAGKDETVCYTNYVLNGNSPSKGMGEWLIISGDGKISNPLLFNSDLEITKTPITLKWTTTNGSCIDSDQVTIKFDNSIEIEKELTDKIVGIGQSITFTVRTIRTDLSYKWFFNDDEIDDITKNSYKILIVSEEDIGKYRVEISDKCGGTASSRAGLLLVATNKDRLEYYGIKLYPNPSEGIVNFSYDKTFELFDLQVTNLNGKIIYKNSNKNIEKIDISGHPKGIYLVKITIDNREIISRVAIK